MLIDLRELASPVALESDVCIVGGGPAGITLALALGRAGIETCLLESGGLSSAPETHALTQTEPGGPAAMDGLVGACRLRYLGGASNHWGGWLATPAGGWPQPLWGGCHHMGTTRMAASPRAGVVDHDCKVHGIDNLYVAGSSVFATGGCTNPTLTIVALALRLADHLAR